jgi:uncharacterized protein (DUF885 family)
MKQTILALILVITSLITSAQKIVLPTLTQLHQAVDEYYTELTASQQQENEETNKKHWLSYIPSPSYNPFAGGFGASMNLSAPIQELAAKRTRKHKNEAIKRLNLLQAKDLKNQITIQYQIIKINVEEYKQRKVIDSLKEKSYNLSQQFYIQNQLSPSEFLQLQQAYETHKLTRITDENNIKKAILQLLNNSKMATITSSSH